jgi:hypothetical protein
MVHIERMMFDEHAAEIIHSNAAMSDRSNPEISMPAPNCRHDQAAF